MILYDQNGKFLGMSSETLSYLGYEDLSDFTSQHSDFANLLVQKEGYIYKFENFSWIDFILYSGSPNKAGLLKLKSGKELEIKISVKEVHLVDEINGTAKYYSIRILTDDFVQVASQVDASIIEKSPVKNNFNLSNLMGSDSDTLSPKESAPLAQMPEQESQEETVNQADNNFVLNFPSQEELSNQEDVMQLDLREPKEEEVQVPMTDSLLKTTDDNQFKLNLSDSLMDEDITVEDTPQSDDSFSLNIQEEKSQESVMPSLEEAQSATGISLDFLKTVEEPVAEVNKEETIAQIQEDLEEINQEEEKKSFTSTLESLSSDESVLSTTAMDTNNDLGLERDEEHGLLTHFIEESKENIALLSEYIASHNETQAEYTLIKIQSSANILNLNAIIATTDAMKQTKDKESTVQLLATLKEQVLGLESQLTHETA